MNAVGLSLTARHGLSLTKESAYRKPNQGLSPCKTYGNRPRNSANKDSFGILLTPKHLLATPDNDKKSIVEPVALPSGIFNNLFKRTPKLAPPPDPLTHVTLTWIEKRQEDWIRFGHPVKERIIDRRRRVESFAPNSIFGFIRWAANDYGTIHSSITIVRAVSPGEPYVTVPQIDPGGDVLLRIKGWSKVGSVLQIIDTIDALDIDLCTVAPDYWQHVHHRLITNTVPRRYTLARHRAWLARKALSQ